MVGSVGGPLARVPDMNLRNWKSLTAVSICIAGALGCSRKPDSETEAAKLLGVSLVTEADRAQAREIFSQRCATCHGPTGGGDGPASAGLSPKPRNFHDASWQGSVSTEYLTRIIRFGGAAVGKSAVMPANADIADKHAVIAALTGHVRSLGQ
jgi:mono/diheme cytochrome c family protein